MYLNRLQRCGGQADVAVQHAAMHAVYDTKQANMVTSKYADDTCLVLHADLSRSGMTKAAVLPEPVRAMPTTSCLCKISGRVFRWMGVGSLYPLRLIPLSTSGLRPKVSATGNALVS